MNKVIQGDCLEVMKDIPDKSIDLILCDLPYGTTACKWDTIIPFEPLWKEYKRIIKDNGAIVLTASQPFTSALVMSNVKMFKYEWIWEKPMGTNFAAAKYVPLKNHENVLVFGKGTLKYTPQMETRGGSGINNIGKIDKPPTIKDNNVYGEFGFMKNFKTKARTELAYPKTVKRFTQDRGLHPTQKPVALFEYLIKTYTNEGDLVLDNCAGSGTTGVAARNLNRNLNISKL